MKPSVAKEHAEYPDPEKTALDWATHLQTLINARINYWLLTESILFVAFAGVLNASLGEPGWLIVYVLSWIGLFFTFLWHTLLTRARSWYDWFFTRATLVHARRCGVPLGKYDAENVGVFPPRGYMSWGTGDGLSLGMGSIVIASGFALFWLVLGAISADAYWSLARETRIPLVILSALLFAVYVTILLKLKHVHDRKV